MNEDLVCGFQTARKLAKYGLSQESVFYWKIIDDGEAKLVKGKEEDGAKYYAAYTATEAANRFPKDLWILFGEKSYRRKEGLFYFVKHNGIYKVSLMIRDHEGKDYFELYREEDSNEAEARSKMICYLYQQKMMELAV